MTLQLPTIHLNGSSKSSLVEDICIASGVVRDALNALYRIVPNQRDYYPQGDDAWKRALQQHVDRCDKIKAVLTELEELATGIDDGGHKP